MYTHKIISIYFLPENSFWSRVDCVPIGILSWMTSPSSHHPGHPVLLCNLCWLVNWMPLCRLGQDHLSLVSSSLYHEVFLSRPRGRNLLNWMSADHLQWWYRLQSLSSLIKHLKKKEYNVRSLLGFCLQFNARVKRRTSYEKNLMQNGQNLFFSLGSSHVNFDVWPGHGLKFFR